MSESKRRAFTVSSRNFQTNLLCTKFGVNEWSAASQTKRVTSESGRAAKMKGYVSCTVNSDGIAQQIGELPVYDGMPGELLEKDELAIHTALVASAAAVLGKLDADK